MRVTTERAASLDDALERLTATDHLYRYSVAWIDCAARGDRFGRGCADTRRPRGGRRRPSPGGAGIARRAADPGARPRLRVARAADPQLDPRGLQRALLPACARGDRRGPAGSRASSSRSTRSATGTGSTVGPGSSSTSSSCRSVRRARSPDHAPALGGTAAADPRRAQALRPLERTALVPVAGLDASPATCPCPPRARAAARPCRRDRRLVRRQGLPGQGLAPASRAPR